MANKMSEDFQKRFDHAKEILADNGIVDCHFIRFQVLHQSVMSLKPHQDENNLKILHALSFDLVNVTACSFKNLSMESQDYNLAYKIWNSQAVLILSKLYKTNYGSNAMENYLQVQKFYSTPELMKTFASDHPLQIFPEEQKQEMSELQSLLGGPLLRNIVQENSKAAISEKASSSGNEDDVVLATLIVIYIPQYWEGDKLKSMFERYGEVTDTRIIKNPRGISKGYGFVDFKDSRASLIAMKALDGKNIDGKNLKVMVAGCGTKSNLFVWNIPADWSVIDLEKVFSQFGVVTDKRILRKNGKTRYCGFVRFVSKKCAQEAQRALHQISITYKGKSVVLKVQPAKKNPPRNKHLEKLEAVQEYESVKEKLPGMHAHQSYEDMMFQQHKLTMQIYNNAQQPAHQYGAIRDPYPTLPMQIPVEHEFEQFRERKYEDKLYEILERAHYRKFDTKQMKTDVPSTIAPFRTRTLKDSDSWAALKALYLNKSKK